MPSPKATKEEDDKGRWSQSDRNQWIGEWLSGAKPGCNQETFPVLTIVGSGNIFFSGISE